MENLVLKTQSKDQISDYITGNHLMAYKPAMFREMLQAIEIADQVQLDRFRSFGNSFKGYNDECTFLP